MRGNLLCGHPLYSGKYGNKKGNKLTLLQMQPVSSRDDPGIQQLSVVSELCPHIQVQVQLSVLSSPNQICDVSSLVPLYVCVFCLLFQFCLHL